MEISQVGINLIKEFEGCILTAYRDPIGIWTIGYGRTKGVYPGQTITQEQADAFLKEDVKSHTVGIDRNVTVPLTQNQYDALASFHYNLGANILSGTTLKNQINAKDWQGAANSINLYVNAGGKPLPGLIRRRKAEADLFLEDAITPEKPIIAPQNKPKFKVGDKVVLIAGAKNWNSYRGAPITPKFSVEDMVIPFEVKSVSTGNLTYKIARLDYQEINGWVDERHVAIAPTNDIKPMDKVTLRRQATNWVGGDKINETDKTEYGKSRVFAVKERKENRLLIYINGWERWAFDWDCVPFK